MSIDWVKVLEQLKDIKGFRFYFLIAIMGVLIITFTFKDEISIRLKDMSLKRVEFRDVRNLKGLEVNLETIMDSTMRGYAVYIYQPKDKSYHKRVVATNSDLVKTPRLQGSYLEDQVTINEAFRNDDYILLDHTNPTSDTQYIHEMGIPYLFVYRLGPANGVIGEIQIGFDEKPDNKKIKELKTKLAPLIHLYVL